MLLSVDLVTSAYGAVVAMDATNDFQIDAASDTAFLGRLTATGIVAATALHVMTNRGRNAYTDGAVGEIVITGDVGNRALYYSYLATKWRIS